MPIDPDVQPLLDDLATRITALETAGVKTHAHTEYATSGHAHAGTPAPVPTPVPEPTPTPTPPPTPPPVPPPPVTLPDIPAGTDVNASEIVAKLAAAPNGTVFRVRPGSAGGTLTLKPGQQVWGLDPGNKPLFNGAGTQWFAKGPSESSPAADVVLANLKFTNYNPAPTTWVNVSGESYRKTASGVYGRTMLNAHLFQLEGFENGTAVDVGNGMLVEKCLFYRNHHTSVYGWRKTGVRIVGGEWHNNNRRPDGRPYYNWSWEASTKFVECTGFVVDGLFSHHNIGPGIWFDINNDQCTIKNCRTEDNQASGIFWEISYRAIIENNQSHRNRDAANIYVSNGRGASPADPIIVRGNKTSGHGQWEIGLKGEGTRTPKLDFVKVENNTVDGLIKQYLEFGHPVPTSTVAIGNKKSDGTAVALSK